ncbi:MAG: site-specific integrase, partial [candidate division Zixibacteria bacterium]|nr:site-specific integrase [candidate division Zixibacteria bacterium]
MSWKIFLEKFLTHIALERNLSDNTLLSYELDLKRYTQFLEQQKIENIEDISAGDIQNYSEMLTQLGLSSNSVARNFSAIRSFHKFLVLDGVTAKNPTELLETPRLSRRLPEVLSIDEITRIIECPEAEDP